jgi:[histone H3]-trimethyl-L-lysine9/36 demethylase
LNLLLFSAISTLIQKNPVKAVWTIAVNKLFGRDTLTITLHICRIIMKFNKVCIENGSESMPSLLNSEGESKPEEALPQGNVVVPSEVADPNTLESALTQTAPTSHSVQSTDDTKKTDVDLAFVTSSDQSNCHSSVDSSDKVDSGEGLHPTVALLSSDSSEMPLPVLVTTENEASIPPSTPSRTSSKRYCRMKKEISNEYSTLKSNATSSLSRRKGKSASATAKSSLTPANGLPCIMHTPSVEELQRMTFSDYVRSVVLPAAAVDQEDSDSSEEEDEAPTASVSSTPNKKAPLSTTEPMILKEGIAKIRLPDGFFTSAPYGKDTTGRGPAWDAGTDLGDRLFHNPIAQNIRGMAGVYEYTHTELKAMTLAEFRDRADQYRIQQMGSALLEFKKEVDDTAVAGNVEPKTAGVENVTENISSTVPSSDAVDTTEQVTGELTLEQVELLERQFWKRLSPTMPPAIYGADEVGSLFGDDAAASGWSLANLDSCLHVLPDIPGVTSPYLYAGMWASVFCAHAEDMNLLSINYLHAGQPKIWYAVAERDAARFISLAEHHFAHQLKKCKEFLRHKRCLLSPSILQKAGIRYQTAVQYPGDAIITFPGGFHFGFNAGFNIAEATNFGVLEWLPFGRRAKVCLCRPDSVRIDMNRLTYLLQRYHIDYKRNKRLTWKEWRKRLERKETALSKSSIEETEDEIIEVISYAPKKRKRKSKGQLSEQQRKKEFWIEVTLPSQFRKTPVVNNKKKSSKSQKLNSNPWYLARPVGRKRLEVQTKVLCLVPAPSNLAETTAIKDLTLSSDEADLEEEPLLDVDANVEEICFTGTIVEIADGHALIHFDGQGKSDDIWMPLSSPKLFLNGGLWNEESSNAVVVSDDKDKLQVNQGTTSNNLPPLHYWKEMDSNELDSTA